MKCKFCDREILNTGGLKRHENCCKLNPDRKPPSQKWLDSVAERVGTRKGKGTNQYTKYPGYKISDSTREKLRKAHTGRYWTEEKKLRHSAIMKQKVLENPDSYSKSNVSGRVKIYEISGTKVKGLWELDVARYLNSLDINWTNDIEPIPYMWNDKQHIYFPDFFLPEYDMYIEVKGYKRERDLAKWKSLSNLIVLEAKEIKSIREGTYNLLHELRSSYGIL